MKRELTALAQLAPPAHCWDRIATQLAERVPPRRPAWHMQHLAAALVLALLALPLYRLLEQNGNDDDIDLAATRLRPWLELSRQLEAQLQAMPQRPRIEKPATSAAIDRLEQRIQWLDARLSEQSGELAGAAEIENLWSQRVALLDSLYGVRYAEVARSDQWINTLNGDI